MYASSNPQYTAWTALQTTKQLTSGTVLSSAGVTAITSSSSMSADCSLGNVFTLVPAHTGTITFSNMVAGQPIWLVITTSGTSSYTLTFGGSTDTGTLATGVSDAKVFVVSFIGQTASTLNEVKRTIAQT